MPFIPWRVVQPLVAVMIICTLAAGCRHGPITEDKARRAASERFVRVCRDFHYDQHSFDGPAATGVGGAAFAYEWRSKTVGSDFGILITVDFQGVTDVSFLGHIPGVKYLK